MAQQPYNPKQDPAVMLAAAVYHERHTAAGRAIVALLRHRFEAAKDLLVALAPGSNAPPGALLHMQGQAHALKELLKDIEEGPLELQVELNSKPKQPEQA